METKAHPVASAQLGPKTVRASVGFPAELYKALEDIAKEKKVSVAWIVRDAAEQYIAQRWPLLSIARSQSGTSTN
jgi:metal-responsive CopG/Arc/MetJ family transcriptional regulator